MHYAQFLAPAYHPFNALGQVFGAHLAPFQCIRPTFWHRNNMSCPGMEVLFSRLYGGSDINGEAGTFLRQFPHLNNVNPDLTATCRVNGTTKIVVFHSSAEVKHFVAAWASNPTPPGFDNVRVERKMHQGCSQRVQKLHRADHVEGENGARTVNTTGFKPEQMDVNVMMARTALR